MYKDVFVPHDYRPPARLGQSTYVKPSGDMASSSTYRADYPEKRTKKPTLAKPDYKPVASDSPFDGNTVNNETYKAWDVPRIESIQPPSKGIRKSSAKFDHFTTMQQDYPGHFGKIARETGKPPECSLKTGGGPMSNETTHRFDYYQKSGGPQKSAKPSVQQDRNPGPFSYETTNQNAFTWPSGNAADSCKPVLSPLASDKPFDGETTNKRTYRKWDIQRVEALKPQMAWKIPSQPFDNTTTTRRDFQGKQASKTKSARPEALRVNPGYFDGSTTHNETYKPWQYSQAEMSKPKTGYRPPTVPFEGQTTHMNDFRGEKATRPDICMPRENGIYNPGGSQEYSTNYGDDFKRKSLPSCPAKDLQLERTTSGNGFHYVRDTNGHQYFYPPNAMGMGERTETVALA